MRTFKNVLALMAIGLCWIAAATAVQANIKLDIDSQPLNTALNAFATQSGLQVVFSAEVGKGLMSVSLKGNYTPETAMKELLANTPFEYRFLNERTVEVRVKTKAGAWNTPVEQMRLADGSKAATSTEESAGPSGKKSSQSDQMVVTDSKLKIQPFSTANTDLTRTEDDVLPFTVFTAREIEQSGAVDLTEFFRNRLSQNFNTVIREEAREAGNSGMGGNNTTMNQLGFVNGAGAQGRNGARDLVVLVNGRRLPGRHTPTGNDSFQEPNYRAIPIASIERIELLSSAAGALYGAGAAGAVINIITKENFRGGSLALSYENPMDAHAPKPSVEFSYGTSLGRGFSARVFYGASASKPLTVEDRLDVLDGRWRQLIMARAPQLIMNPALTPPLGATPNIKGTGTQGLFGSGSSRVTSVPDGYAGGQGVAAFLSRQGIYNLDIPEVGTNSQANGLQSQLGPTTRLGTIAFEIDKTFASGWRMTMGVMREKETHTGKYEYPFQFATVTAAAPANPFGQTVQVMWSDPRLGRLAVERGYTFQARSAFASLRGRIGRWHVLADVNYLEDVPEFIADDFRPLGSGPNGGSLSAAIESGLYNPFVDMRTVAPAPASFYQEYDYFWQRGDSHTKNYQAMAKVSRELSLWSSRPAQLTAGLEGLRQDRGPVWSGYKIFNSRTGIVTQTGGAREDQLLFSGHTYAAYAEATVPLLPRQRTIPLVKGLEVFAAGRSSQQTINGSLVTNNGFYVNEIVNGVPNQTLMVSVVPRTYKTDPHVYSAGVKWELWDGIFVRASRSVGYRPPLITEVTPSLPPTTSTTPLQDRRTGQTVVLGPTMWRSGGNSAINPETTVADNFGLILAPARLKGFRLFVDYLESARDDAITAVALQALLDLELTEPALTARIQRDSAGAITFMDASTINFRKVISKSATASVEQVVPGVRGGELLFTAAVTKNISFRQQVSATSQPQEFVHVPIAGSLAVWNANAQVSWQGANWTLGWSAKYSDSILIAPTSYVAQGSNRIDSIVINDAFVTHRFGADGQQTWQRGLLADTTLTLGVKNIFDRDPRFSSSSTLYYRGDSIYGRSAWLQLRKSF